MQLVGDCMNTENMDNGTEGDEDHSGNWFKKVELVAHLKRELCVKEGNGWKGKGKGEDGENEQECDRK